MISDVLGFQDKLSGRSSCERLLSKHHSLLDLLPMEYHSRRIVPLTTVKSHTMTHRRHLTEVQYLSNNDTCLNNALRYEYYDKILGICNPKVHSTQSIPKKCLYSMPERSKTLERFMCKPLSAVDGVAPNDIMVC
jgi:hypothetical protein